MTGNLGKGIIVFAVLLALTGCGRGGADKGQSLTSAIVVLNPTAGNHAQGNVTFTQEGSGVRVIAQITGLKPGQHGFHIHEYGDCSSPDANSAGGHFNPKNASHGTPTGEKRHAGDLGNIEADQSGTARLELVDPVLSLDGSESILGRAVIVHADADDFKTQPTGGSGARLACGVIGIAKK